MTHMSKIRFFRNLSQMIYSALIKNAFEKMF